MHELLRISGHIYMSGMASVCQSSNAPVYLYVFGLAKLVSE